MTKAYNVTLIPGDGIGPELVETVKMVLAGTGVNIKWDTVLAGESAIAQFGTPLPDQVLASIKKNKVALKGPITTPIGTGFRSVNVALRTSLNLYACLRPCKTYPGVKSFFPSVDLVVVRENTEDLYAGVEFLNSSIEAQEIIKMGKGKIFPDANISIKPISKTGTERIAKFAFEYAVKHGRKKVTAVAKANIMKFTDGLFYEVCKDVARNYPQIQYEERLVDNMCMQLVQKPDIYDVLVLPNLYGDIISDLCAGLVGGLGVAPGANHGTDIALFEPVHGSAPKYKGLNKTNPTALLLSAKMMLEHLGEAKIAEKLEKAVSLVIQEKQHVTYDMGGKASTSEMGEAILKKFQSLE